MAAQPAAAAVSLRCAALAAELGVFEPSVIDQPPMTRLFHSALQRAPTPVQCPAC
jgi:hypothetical protein